MNMYFHLRAVPPAALRNSTAWLQRLFEDDWDTVRRRLDLNREELLDNHYLDHDRLYACTPPHHVETGPWGDVVLGGRPVFPADRDRPPFLVLTAARTARVAAFLAKADFDALWRPARDSLLPRYGGLEAEPQTRCAFASAHRDLTAFYTRTAESGDAVVKWLVH